jgi:Xaa-Pro aminopeptidase
MVDAYKRCRDYLDQAIALIKPGITTGQVASVWPKATEFGFPNEEAAFGLQYGHGIGTAIWERPVISRLVSIDHPEVIQEGMVFALETFWPAKGSHHAARIEEEMVVTATGCEVISKFPAEDLLVCGRQYWSGHGMLPGVRHSESHYNNARVFPQGVDTTEPRFGNTWEA